MEVTNFDRKKVIEEMRALKEKRINEIEALNEQNGIEAKVPEIEQNLTIKYLGKMEFTVEGKEELIEKDVYMTIEEIDGQFQFRYYDEEQNLIGIQMATDLEVMLSTNFSSKTMEEQLKMKKALEEKDKEEAKTLEELEEEQQTEEKTSAEEEPQQLPGVEDEGPQLTKAQVNSMKGPKTSLSQIVDAQTLGNIIGLEGKYMQLVDADTIRKLIPDIQIPTNQKTIPIEIFPDGSANVIGEDKLQFSKQEGTNSSAEHTTVTNEGLVRNEQNIETFNITSKGGMHTIAVGYDENGGMPLEVKYGWRHVEETSKITYSELETVHEGPMQQDDDTNQYKQDATEGIDKPKTVAKEDAERYAKAKGLYEFDNYGNLVGYDLETAEQEILEDGRDIDEIIENLDVKTIEPNSPKSLYE